jgi:TetR/AcrR family transcriptional repressor of nem operon
MTKRDTKAELISAGMELFGTHGYNATGIEAVLKQVGVPKGSFYHYFGSKEEFGLAVIEEFSTRFLARLDVFLSDATIPPLDRLRIFLERGLGRLSDHECTVGCLIGDLGQELAAQNERLRERLDRIMLSWSDRFAACIQEAQAEGAISTSLDPHMTAGFILSGWEGAVLRAKVMKSTKPVRELIDTLFATILTKA